MPDGVTRRTLARDLRRLGVPAGRAVLLHVSLRSLGRVEGGAPAVVGALRDVLGPAGTVVVPATTARNSLTSRAHREAVRGMAPAHRHRLRHRMPPFDAATTPGEAGLVAECVRTSAGAVRSRHPQSSFAALGPCAEHYMRRHAQDCHLGDDSPLGALYDADAHILMLGTGYDTCTALHLAEYRYTEDPPRRWYACVVKRGGRRRWWAYQDVVLNAGDFPELGDALDRTGRIRRGTVGEADSRLMPLRAAVDFAADWLAARRGESTRS